jgi:hypothetical protein
VRMRMLRAMESYGAFIRPGGAIPVGASTAVMTPGGMIPLGLPASLIDGSGFVISPPPGLLGPPVSVGPAAPPPPPPLQVQGGQIMLGPPVPIAAPPPPPPVSPAPILLGPPVPVPPQPLPCWDGSAPVNGSCPATPEAVPPLPLPPQIVDSGGATSQLVPPAPPVPVVSGGMWMMPPAPKSIPYVQPESRWPWIAGGVGALVVLGLVFRRRGGHHVEGYRSRKRRR